ncbi:unnamed protein product [Arctogadus glacialis]
MVVAGRNIGAIFCEPAKAELYHLPENPREHAKVDLIRVINPASGIITVTHSHFAGPTFRHYAKGRRTTGRTRPSRNWPRTGASEKSWMPCFESSPLGAHEPALAEAGAGVDNLVPQVQALLFRGGRVAQGNRLAGQPADKFDGSTSSTDKIGLAVRVWDWHFREQLYEFISEKEQECNSTEWAYEFQPTMKFQEHNSSCVFNAMRALNATYTFIKEHGFVTLDEFRTPVYPASELLSGYRKFDNGHFNKIKELLGEKEGRTIEFIALEGLSQMTISRLFPSSYRLVVLASSSLYRCRHGC